MRQKHPKGFSAPYFACFQCLCLGLWLETESKPFNLLQMCPLNLSEPRLLCISDIPILPALCKLSLRLCLLNASNQVQPGNGGAAQKPMQYAHANTERDR